MDRRRLNLLFVFLFVAAMSLYPRLFPTKLNLGVAVVLFAAMATAWDILGGWAGQLSLGHSALVGVGGYTMALLALRGAVAPWWGLLAAMAVAAAAAAGWGWVTFRLRGPYFVLSTIAVSEILRMVAVNWKAFTGGAQGLFLRDLPRPFGLDLFARSSQYYLGLGLLAVALLVGWYLSWSRFGYYLQAIREDEDSAMAMGINPTRYKILAFMASAAITASGGVLYAIYISFFEPYLVFNLGLSVELALMAYIGGAGTILGPAFGALLLQVAGDAFRQYFQQANLLIYGVLIIIVIRFAPEGLAGGRARLARWWRQAASGSRARQESERA